MLARLSDEGVAQTSYLTACGRMRTAVVIDPRRDVDACTSIANRYGLIVGAHVVKIVGDTAAHRLLD